MIHRPLALTSLLLLFVADSAAPRNESIAAEHASTGRAASPVLTAMQLELARSMATLKTGPLPAYFLSYEITERHSVSVQGAFGTLNSSNESRNRSLGVDLRVGSSRFDNTHLIRGGMPSFDFSDTFSSAPVPIEDDATAIRRVLWHQTNSKYKQAVEKYTRAKANTQTRVAAEDSSADFSPEPAVTATETPANIAIDRRLWEQKIRKYTAPFAREGDIYDGEASLSAEGDTRWYVNSDGSALQTTSVYYRLFISASSKATDGMVLPRYESFTATTLGGLPDDAAVSRRSIA